MKIKKIPTIYFLMLVVILQRAAASETPSVGSLPYSNQWVFEESKASIYLGLQQLSLADSKLTFNRFQSDFGNRSLFFPEIDYFSHLFSFSNPESDSLARFLSLRTRYGVGFLIASGKLSSEDTTIQSSVEDSSLMGLQGRMGSHLNIQFAKWIQIFLGGDASLLGYRHSSSLDGAERQGLGLFASPSGGIQLNAFWNTSLFAELRYDFLLHDSEKILGGGMHYGLGAGLTF